MHRRRRTIRFEVRQHGPNAFLIFDLHHDRLFESYSSSIAAHHRCWFLNHTHRHGTAASTEPVIDLGAGR